MKAHLDDDDGGRRLVGRADVPEECGPVFEVPVFGAASTNAERFAVGAVTHLPEGGGAPVVERAVLAAPGQLVELLPGWVVLARPSRAPRPLALGGSGQRDRVSQRLEPDERASLPAPPQVPDPGVREQQRHAVGQIGPRDQAHLRAVRRDVHQHAIDRLLVDHEVGGPEQPVPRVAPMVPLGAVAFGIGSALFLGFGGFHPTASMRPQGA